MEEHKHYCIKMLYSTNSCAPDNDHHNVAVEKKADRTLMRWIELVTTLGVVSAVRTNCGPPSTLPDSFAYSQSATRCHKIPRGLCCRLLTHQTLRYSKKNNCGMLSCFLLSFLLYEVCWEIELINSWIIIKIIATEVNCFCTEHHGNEPVMGRL